MAKEEELKEYCRPEYWDNRYASEQSTASSSSGDQVIFKSFDWFRDFSKLRAFFRKNLPAPPSDCSLLHLGCGNSTLTADLHALGYTNQVSVDFSQVLISALKIKYADLKSTWLVMDIRNLELDSKSVDLAIDKGTLDSFLHGSVLDWPNDVRENVGKYVDEVARVLKAGGKWLYITSWQPHLMKPLLVREDKWTIEVEILGNLEGAGVSSIVAM